MDAESRIKTIAERYGWPDEVVQDVRTLMASASNAAFDDGRQVERSAWRRRGIEADAARYRWTKAQKGLDLRSAWEGEKWTRPDGSVFYPTHSLSVGGTQVAAAESLDAMIDSAMAEAGE